MKQKLILIGNGMAGIRALEEIFTLVPEHKERYDITVIGKEKYPNYNRIQLSYILQQEREVKDIITHPLDWYEENNIKLITDDPANKIDTQTQVVTTQSGKSLSYDQLIIATGSYPIALPIPGVTKKGNFTFRTIDDTENMIRYATDAKRAVVIGGGLLGLEAADGLKSRGLEVTVVHLAEWLLEMQLDRQAGTLLQQDLEAQGLHFMMGRQTAEILGDDKVTGVRFADGSQIPADMVVMSIGIRPTIQLARQAGLEVNRGIIVNGHLQTNFNNIYALGECVEYHGTTYGLVAPLYEQAKVLAAAITQQQNVEPYRNSNTFTSLKVSSCDLYSAGNISKLQACPSIQTYDSVTRSYKRIYVKDNKVQGIILYGDVSEGNRYYNMMQSQESIENRIPITVLQNSDGAVEQDSVIDWPDSAVVCGCNGVTKGTIVNAIHEHQLSSVAEVGTYTRAGTSCGKCKAEIQQILEHELGAEVKKSEGICSCTDLSRDEVVAAIQSQNLLSTEMVYKTLKFRQPEGCAKCRPAINYYLNMSFPHKHADERASRFVNERMHANIQKDGTFSVIPRMRAGRTDAQQLRRIAEVAEEFNVPLVKVTGSQRIGLYGVKKQDLPAIWEKLDMHSAQAYAKAFRSVKTCVGKEFCRYGTQNSMGLGVELEKRFEFIDTPHKFKVGISACPRSCVEAQVKDFGVIGVENGFQIYIGGNGGTEVVIAPLLTTVATQEEVIEYCGAMLQYYRTTAIYAERTAPWLKRLGFEKVQEVLLDEKQRKTLIADLNNATINSRKEPWREVLKHSDLQEKLYSIERPEA